VKVLVTGGAGFIGSNFVRFLLSARRDVEIVNFDKLTYAGNPESLTDVAQDPRYHFVCGDIADRNAVGELFTLPRRRMLIAALRTLLPFSRPTLSALNVFWRQFANFEIFASFTSAPTKSMAAPPLE
jgi:nucleoside-diphosphate-sugar epimerase